MPRLTLLTLPALALGANLAGAAEVRIVDIKAYAFLEHAGRLSGDLIALAQGLVNAPRGGAPGGDTATALLVEVTFAGETSAAGGAAPGIAKAAAATGARAPQKGPAATVDLTQRSRAGALIVTHRAFEALAFGPEGIAHKAVFLEGATCMPLAIDVRAGRATKQARLDFQCDLVKAPD